MVHKCWTEAFAWAGTVGALDCYDEHASIAAQGPGQESEEAGPEYVTAVAAGKGG